MVWQFQTNRFGKSATSRKRGGLEHDMAALLCQCWLALDEYLVGGTNSMSMPISLFLLITVAGMSAKAQGSLGCYPNAQTQAPTSRGECVWHTGAVTVDAGDKVNDEDPQCAVSLDESVRKIKPHFDKAAASALKAKFGAMGELAYEIFGENVAREIARLISPRAACNLMVIKLKAGATYKRTVFFMLDDDPGASNTWIHVPTSGPYALHAWRKAEEPVVSSTESGIVVVGLVKNWRSSPRQFSMQVIYEE